MSTKAVFESVLSVPMVKKLWTFHYHRALSFYPNSFAMGAVMPAILYMFRWGHRRGKGKFSFAYGDVQNDKKVQPNIERVVEILIKNKTFAGFDSPASQAILGDMLLSFCLENKNHQTGRTEQVLRTYPTHYMASWIDLPDNVVNLRFVPEMVVALLLNQEQGQDIDRGTRRTLFSVGSGFDENILLSLFGNGMEISGQHISNLTTSDVFRESDLSVGIDQLLTIRVAQGCGEAPGKARGEDREQIPNQWPITTIAMKSFREDFSVFVQAYGSTIPRQTFLQMLESSLSLGLTNIFFTTIGMLLEWGTSGSLPSSESQKPWPLFVDCSTGNDKALRLLSEESMTHLMRSMGRLPIVLMCIRILDEKVRYDRQLRDSLPIAYPDGSNFINFLGSILYEKHQRSQKVLEDIDEECLKISDAMAEAGIEPELQELLRKNSDNSVVRLAEALCYAMRKNQYIDVINSLLMTDEPNGMAQQRKGTQKDISGKPSRADIRSVVLTNPMLDYIVHRHLRKAAKGKGSKPLTFIEFKQILKERYGLFVDESPPGMSIPIELLLRNKRILERRLRDLGVLVGVNDAEEMKYLRQRFRAKSDE